MYTEASSWDMVFPKEKWDDDFPDSGRSERLTQRKTDQRKFEKRSGMMIIQILVNLNGLLKGKLTKGNLAYVMVVVQTIH